MNCKIIKAVYENEIFQIIIQVNGKLYVVIPKGKTEFSINAPIDSSPGVITRKIDILFHYEGDESNVLYELIPLENYCGVKNYSHIPLFGGSNE